MRLFNTFFLVIIALFISACAPKMVDIKRLTDNNADNPRDALMYHARQKGFVSLHVNQEDYLLDNDFANKMVDLINAYEEKMRRYEKEREFPLILRK